MTQDTETAALNVQRTEREPYEAVLHGCGLLERGEQVGLLEISGEDHRRFLNNQVTCDVKALEEGDSAYGFFTSIKGRVLADVTVVALDGRFLLLLPREVREEIRQHMERYILVDRVELRTVEELAAWSLVGPRSLEAAGVLGAELAALEAGRHREITWGAETLRALRRPFWGLEAVTLWCAAGTAEAMQHALLGSGGEPEVTPVGPEAVEVARVEAGAPRFGRDYGSDHFPQETGIDAAVSYTKGCYLGQEVVARIHYRGQVNRVLCGLIVHGAGARPRAALGLDGQEVGALGTVVASPALGQEAALAILHRKAAAPGTVLSLPDGGTAEVRELPLVARSSP